MFNENIELIDFEDPTFDKAAHYEQQALERHLESLHEQHLDELAFGEQGLEADDVLDDRKEIEF